MDQMTIDEVLEQPPGEEGDDQEAGGDGGTVPQLPAEEEMEDTPELDDPEDEDDEPDA